MVETKLINGLKVVYNHSRNLTIATLSDNSLAELKAFLKSNPEATVVINPNSWKDFEEILNVHDFEVLKELPEIKRVILIINWEMDSISGLYHLKNLVKLDAWLASFLDLDFSFFQVIEDVAFNWTPKTQNFFGCNSLRVIRVWKYKATDKTLSEFGVFNNVENLGIIQSNITTIKGLENVRSLKKLELAYNTALEINDNDLGFKLPNVEVLEINTCRKIGLSFVKVFPNVRKLTLVQFQDIQALRPILDGLPKLEELFVGQTKILETDNSYYLDYPHIKEFFFAEKKYHKLKNKDLERN